MCRAVIYLGKKTSMADFTHRAYNSLVNQSIHPQYMQHGFNLTGNGYICWQRQQDKHLRPILYKSKLLPFYDYIYEMQSKMLETDCFISHIRGGVLSNGVVLTAPNAHPFLFEGTDIALAHNGGLHNGTLDQQQAINTEMTKEMDPKWYGKIRGTTDSEHIYALLLTALERHKRKSIERALPEALFETFSIIKNIRRRFKVFYASPVNLFISNGEFIAVVRFTFDFGRFNDQMTKKHLTFYSLWYTYGQLFEKQGDVYQMTPGKRHSICFASEPLSKNTSTWLEVPEYSLIIVKRGNPLKMHITDLDL
jgi:glutamine amidotransferase